MLPMALRAALGLLCLLATVVAGRAGKSVLAPVSSSAGEWGAEWIVALGTEPEAYGVDHFRRTFELAAVPVSFPVQVTAENRYELFVNGRRVAAGPARGSSSTGVTIRSNLRRTCSPVGTCWLWWYGISVGMPRWRR